MLDQTIIHQISGKTCKLGQIFVQHILKNIWQLRNPIADVIVPLDELRMLDAFNCFDANSIEQRDRIAGPDIKKSSDDAADVCTNLDNTIHGGDLSQSFDH
jgi:hypothetical protein